MTNQFYHLLFAYFLFNPTDLFACACCANPNVWKSSTFDSTTDEVIFKDLGFVGNMEEQNGAADPEVSDKEIARFQKLKGKHDLKSGNLSFSNAHGTFNFTYSPDTMEKLITDNSFMSSNTCGGGNCYYKKFRAKGKLTLNGSSLALQNNNAFLVFQGEGNECPSNSDLKKWILTFTIKQSKDPIVLVGLFGHPIKASSRGNSRP